MLERYINTNLLTNQSILSRANMEFDLGFNHLDLSKSEIIKSFNDKTIFITGVTGFVGKVMLEKFLRVCDTRKIYVTIREKKGKSAQERLKKIFNLEIFNYVRRHRPNFKQHVQIMLCSLEKPNLGLKSEDLEILKNEVTHVFHVAADVKFNLPLEESLDSNVRPVYELKKIAPEIRNLESFIHVSTAYSNCLEDCIKEEIYQPPITAETVFQLHKELKGDQWANVAKALMKDWPNTYTFTKCIAESLVASMSGQLPIAIVRPAIITSSYVEPVIGWSDTFIGAPGLFVGMGIGAIRVMYARSDVPLHFVPLDFSSNCILAASWFSTQNILNKKLPIYNLVGNEGSVLTIEKSNEIFLKEVVSQPSSFIFRYPSPTLEGNKTLFRIKAFLYHTLPAAIADLVLLALGKKRWILAKMNYVNDSIMSTSFFANQFFKFTTGNIDEMWDNMNATDKEIFNFSISRISHEEFFKKSILGVRHNLLHEFPGQTIESITKNGGINHYNKMHVLKIIHYITLFIYYYFIYKIIMFVITLFF